jgi:hypothetical protein
MGMRAQTLRQGGLEGQQGDLASPYKEGEARLKGEGKWVKLKRSEQT